MGHASGAGHPTLGPNRGGGGAGGGPDPEANDAKTLSDAFYDAFTGFAFNKLGLSSFGPATSSFLDGSLEGAAVLGNGNTQSDVLSLKIVTALKTSPWLLQYRAKFPAMALIADGSMGLSDVGANNWLLISQKNSVDATHVIWRWKTAGVEHVPRVTTALCDTNMHVWGLGMHDGVLYFLRDGVVIDSISDLSTVPSAAMFAWLTCNTVMQPSVAWYSFSYIAP